MKTARPLAAAILFFIPIPSAFAQAPPPTVAFVNVNLISMDRERVEPGQTVIVQGDRIAAIGESNPPSGAVVVDGTGRYLLPGLIDSHVHLTTDMPWAPARDDFGDAPLYLAHGVTTVVNLRGTPTQLDWKRRIEAGEMLGPTIYTSGEFVNEPRVTTPDEVQREVAAQAREGYDLIKFHEIWSPGAGFTTGQGLSGESYVRMFEAARKEGLQVVGHAPITLGLDGLLASSGGAVAHVGELVRLHFRPPLWVLLADIGAAAILLSIVAGWGIAALLRRWRGTTLMSKTLARARLLVSTVLAAYLAAFVVGALAGLGGQFFDSVGWRLGFVALSCGLVIVSLLTVLVSVRVWRDGTVPISSRLSVMLAALVSLVVAYTLSVHSIPSIWKTGDTGRARVAARLRDAGISVQTTLGVYEVGFGGAEAAARVLSDPSFASLTPQTQSLWREFAAQPRPGVLMRLIEVPPRYAEFTRAIAGSLHRNGVQLLAGTDAMGVPMAVPGSSLLRELNLLSQSGLTPYEVIRTATVNPARFLGKENEVGSIAVGKRADLVLLERNPLEDLSAFNQPVGVMGRGRWLPRARLQEALSALHNGKGP
jgi:imidazolonepropionase-like amidohydrolase